MSKTEAAEAVDPVIAADVMIVAVAVVETTVVADAMIGVVVDPIVPADPVTTVPAAAVAATGDSNSCLKTLPTSEGPFRLFIGSPGKPDTANARIRNR